MAREGSLEEISDGKLYSSNDMVKIDCHDCEGCSECCHGLCKLIILDPYDAFEMMSCEQQSFEELLLEKLELNVVDGIILPNLKAAEGTDHCAFLNEKGMCGIHGHRPGICRLYPLGRFYEDKKMHYILQVGECEHGGKTKVKVSKWLGIPRLAQYERYILVWHDFLKELREQLPDLTPEEIRSLDLYIVKQFFLLPYDLAGDFYEQFEKRMTEAVEMLLS